MFGSVCCFLYFMRTRGCTEQTAFCRQYIYYKSNIRTTGGNMVLEEECKRMEYSLSQSNKGENCHVVAYTNDEDKPQGCREMLHIRDLDHFG